MKQDDKSSKQDAYRVSDDDLRTAVFDHVMVEACKLDLLEARARVRELKEILNVSAESERNLYNELNALLEAVRDVFKTEDSTRYSASRYVAAKERLIRLTKSGGGESREGKTGKELSVTTRGNDNRPAAQQIGPARGGSDDAENPDTPSSEGECNSTPPGSNTTECDTNTVSTHPQNVSRESTCDDAGGGRGTDAVNTTSTGSASGDVPGNSNQTGSGRPAPSSTSKVGNLLVDEGTPLRGEPSDKGVTMWFRLTDSPADLPYKLAWEAYKESTPHPWPNERSCDGLYGCWRVGDCERCGSAGIDLRADAPQETPCPICHGDGGRYEMRQADESARTKGDQ